MFKLLLFNIKKFGDSAYITATIFEDLKIFFKNPFFLYVLKRIRLVFLFEFDYEFIKGHTLSQYQNYKETDDLFHEI